MRQTILLLAAVILASGCVQTMDSIPENEEDMNISDEIEEENNISDTSSLGPEQEQNIVYYTSDGFQPSSITIEQGETVSWISNGSRAMEVASDRHPTHTQYAGSSRREHCRNGDQIGQAFDQCSEGDEFSFTFATTGEWGYHNHEFAAHGGTVTVE